MMRMGILLALLINGSAMAATILTFDATGIFNGAVLDQNYGDRVTGPSNAFGSYGTTDGNYTPNVLVDNGLMQARLWTTGYGNLTNVFYEDQDGVDLSFTLTADSGFLVRLQSFDLASFGAVGTITPEAVSVRDGSGNLLFALDSLTVSSTARNTLTPQVAASQLVVTIRASALGLSSDNVALDNITFSQEAAPTDGVPEPGTWATVAGALIGLLVVRRRRISPQPQNLIH